MYNIILGGVQFPIAPPSISLTINNKNETVTLMSEGEVNILKRPGLSDISFELLLPNSRYPFARYPNGYQPATYYLERLEQFKISEKPFQFIFNRVLPTGRLLFDTNMTVSLEEYTIDEDQEELGFDVKVTISLKQFIPYGTKRLKIQSPATATQPQKVTTEKQRGAVGKVTPKNYTVKKGDTLWSISKSQYGNANQIDAIAKLNNLPNKNLISVGQILKLPSGG